MRKHVILIFAYLCFMEISLTIAQLEYPTQLEIDQRKANIAGRTPFYSPSRCKKHELLYPGDQESDWICDCEPAAVYHPESDACHRTFYQGPCKNEHMLVLGSGQLIPECIPNVCKENGKVMINNVCYDLGGKEPCQNSHLSYVLGVNTKTLQLDCIKLSLQLQTRFSEDTETPPFDLATVNKCSVGSKRAINRQCQPIK